LIPGRDKRFFFSPQCLDHKTMGSMGKWGNIGCSQHGTFAHAVTKHNNYMDFRHEM
jgi:hypothetical protein